MSDSSFLEKFYKIAAVLLAISVCAYLILCGKSSRETVVAPVEPLDPNAQYRSIECQDMAARLRQMHIFLSTSKAGPSANEINKKDSLQSEFNIKCAGDRI
ncbi:hypothetical protein CH373_12510 [Leptospira perolatii]|uniref:Uncharacterized protein n=1 Tax=Leptospira perolatii TaxID=2023191 RepID=A0A2M9ZLK9_9LEPT|nr:hypothetical protein [Leptospira perolatii]PJZ70242.1 hypothetical protein CH360_06460 [Leptospira perolatii]PJZ72874.1 hypothetical protein CH373_12510 [Leptospira perolatii]